MLSPERQSAHIVAGTLALLSREIKEAGSPVNLWSPSLTPFAIRELAALVGSGRAVPIWADERHPARGLLVYSRSKWESDCLGFWAARLSGPFMVVEEPHERKNRVLNLAKMAVGLARTQSHRLVIIKAGHDPATLQGLAEAGFVIGELGALLEVAVPLEKAAMNCPNDMVFLKDIDFPQDAAATLGGFIYDGAARHDPLLGPEAAHKIWLRTVLDDLSGAASPAVLLWDRAKDRAVAIGTARVHGDEGRLSAMAVHPAYRNRGLGRLMMSKILDSLVGQVRHFKVEAASYNLPAISLCLKMGFTPGPPIATLHHHNLYGR